MRIDESSVSVGAELKAIDIYIKKTLAKIDPRGTRTEKIGYPIGVYGRNGVRELRVSTEFV